MFIKDLVASWFDFDESLEFKKIVSDSRMLQVGDLFLAIPGHQVDGRHFITQALKKNISAVLCHTDNPAQHGTIEYLDAPVLYFHNLVAKIPELARRAYPFDVALTDIVAVTGTNGKTSVTQLMAQLVNLLGKKAAVLGTIGNGLWGEIQATQNTTSDPITTARLLHEFQQSQAQLIAMEVSSHGLVQNRVEGVPFQLAIFTNLTHDHLDYHGSLRNYALAKRRLFEMPSVSKRLFNIDDATGQQWHQEFAPNALSYSVLSSNSTADYQIIDACYEASGVTATLRSPREEIIFQSPLLGGFNLSNVVAALAGLEQLGFKLSAIAPLVSQLQPIAGRMELFQSEQSPAVVVDYAHTPDALEQALSAARLHCKGKLWCVFGCGGERDIEKRPLMTAIAERLADQVILTADNPRSESVEDIIHHMKQGMNSPQSSFVMPNRQQAIQEVLQKASQDDLVLIAGKGHETYQEIQGIKHDYNERTYVAQLLEEVS